MDKEVQQSISDTINYLKQRINDISKESEGSHNYQNLIDKIAQKSIRTLKATSDSLKKSAKEFKDSKEATQSLNFLKEKAKALTDLTLEKIEEIKSDPSFAYNKSKFKESLGKISFKCASISFVLYDIIKDNLFKLSDRLEECKYFNVIKNKFFIAVDKGSDILCSGIEGLKKHPSVEAQIENAKDLTIDLATKGLEGLKRILGRE